MASSNPFKPSTEAIRRSFNTRFFKSARTFIQNLDDSLRRSILQGYLFAFCSYGKYDISGFLYDLASSFTLKTMHQDRLSDTFHSTVYSATPLRLAGSCRLSLLPFRKIFQARKFSSCGILCHEYSFLGKHRSDQCLQARLISFYRASLRLSVQIHR